MDDKRSLALAGIHFGGNASIDVYYETLKDEYPWIFKEDAYSDIQALTYIYEYLLYKKPKERDTRPHNHVVIWTLSIRLFNINICTLYGRKPSELIECIDMIQAQLQGDRTYYYIHKYVFLNHNYFL